MQIQTRLPETPLAFEQLVAWDQGPRITVSLAKWERTKFSSICSAATREPVKDGKIDFAEESMIICTLLLSYESSYVANDVSKYVAVGNS